MKEHPTEAPSEWVKKLQDLEEGNNHCTKTLPLKALLVIGEISQVTCNDPPSQQLSKEGHSSDLYIRCYEEGYDVYDEGYSSDLYIRCYEEGYDVYDEGYSSDLYIRCYEEGTVVICT